MVEAAEQAFGKLSSVDKAPAVKRSDFTGSEIKYRNDTQPFASFAIAVEGVSWAHPDYYPLFVANSVGRGINLEKRLAAIVAHRFTLGPHPPLPFCLFQLIGTWDTSFGGSKNLSCRLARQVATHNLAHSFMSFHTAYSDTGLWGVFATAPYDKLEDFCYELTQEWLRISQVWAEDLFYIWNAPSFC